MNPDAKVPNVSEVRLCINHKLELWKRGYGDAHAIACAVPTAYLQIHCAICNGTWAVNQALSKR